MSEKKKMMKLKGIGKTAQIVVAALVSIFIGNGVDSRSKHYWG
jgi:hypothetical protein